MEKLKSFAELVKQGQEDKRIKDAAEQAERLARTTPLLSELFSTIAKSKELSVKQKEEEEPLLNELRKALGNPEEFKKEKNDKILSLVTELENKATEIQHKVGEPKESTTDLEKKFLKLFNRLQTDFQTLKKYVDTKQQGSGGYFGGAGSGEVRILRMDDVVKGQTPQNGSVMTWDSTLNKFKCIMPQTGGGTRTDEEMPYAKRIDFITDDLLYRGEAVVGSLESSPVWRIRKLIIGEDNDVTEIWANGTADYVHTWTDRTIYTYV